MKKINMLIMAGLLSLTSMANAFTLDPTADGTLAVTVDGPSVSDGGFFGIGDGTTASAFFNLVLDTGGFSEAAGTSIDINFPGPVVTTNPVSVFLYRDGPGAAGDGVFDVMTDVLIDSASGTAATISAFLNGTTTYFLQLVGLSESSYNVEVAASSPVPVPAAGILFASALFGAGALGRRKKKTAKTAKTAMIGAFARAS